MELKRVAVYCASSASMDPVYNEAAKEVGRTLAERGLGLVYGGGNVGLMGLCADAALEAGGEVIGVIPQKIVDLERAHQGLTELLVVDSMHARKMMLASLSSACGILPGGFGTLDELFEVLTWNQLGYHRKPVGLFNVEGYYDSLLSFLDSATERKGIQPTTRELLLDDGNVGSLLDRFAELRLPARPKWMDKV
ncbi:MAG: TIGR00730 family Rossman fold protein [Polyangiales bacterium]